MAEFAQVKRELRIPKDKWVTRGDASIDVTTRGSGTLRSDPSSVSVPTVSDSPVQGLRCCAQVEPAASIGSMESL